MHEVYHYVRWALTHYGYWAVIAGLLGEDAGLPLPGETTLMFAAFIAHKTSQLSLFWVIVVGIGAATAGDNLGFLLGRKFGKTLIRWLKKIARLDNLDVDAAKNLIKHHGGATVFFARFIFGLRTVAGPLAGMLGMEWKRFWVYNALGAALWVTVMSIVGYEFANQFNTLLGYFEKASWIIAGALFTTGYLIWRRYKKHYREQHKEQEEPEAA